MGKGPAVARRGGRTPGTAVGREMKGVCPKAVRWLPSIPLLRSIFPSPQSHICCQSKRGGWPNPTLRESCAWWPHLCCWILCSRSAGCFAVVADAPALGRSRPLAEAPESQCRLGWGGGRGGRRDGTERPWGQGGERTRSRKGAGLAAVASGVSPSSALLCKGQNFSACVSGSV